MNLAACRRPLRALALAALLPAASAAAQPAYQVKDLNPTTVVASSSPTDFIDYNGVVLFAATSALGRELWRSDGTTEGTFLVQDVAPGSDSSNPTLLVRCGGYVCFRGLGGVLWRTDGFNIEQVGNLSPSNLKSTPFGTFFTANDGVNGAELWRTDGSWTATVMVKDVRPGSASSGATPLGTVGPFLYFLADDGVTGKDLWKTDGTTSGTVKVKDLPAGEPLVTGGLVELNGRGYFAAAADNAGSEVWATDGTAAGTLRVTDINPGGGNAAPSQLTVFAGALYFAATDPSGGNELWRTTGTGAIRVRDISVGASSSSPANLFVWNGRLFFTAFDGIHGTEVWTTLGPGPTTMLLNDTLPGSGSGGGSWFTAAGPLLFFVASGSSGNTELWATTGFGATQVSDIRPGGSGSSPQQLLSSNGHVLLSANDGVHGQELWVSDGTASATFMLRDICGSAVSSSPAQLTPVGLQPPLGPPNFFFTAKHPTAGVELWKSDGTAAGTVLVADVNPGSASSSPGQLTSFNGNLVFVPTVGDVEPWRSDGTPAGTFPVANINPAGNSNPSRFTVSGGTLYFTANNGTAGTELWSIVGPALGATLVKDLRPGPNSSTPHDLVDLGGTLVFAAHDGVSGDELWRSDGSFGGTALVKDIVPGFAGSSISGMAVMNGVAYFAANTPGFGAELWRSDGTPGGTFMVADIRPGPPSSSPASLTAVGNTLYFAANDGITGVELWKSDGTPAGTALVLDINPISNPILSSTPTSLLNVEGTLFFVADDGWQDFGVWRSDGTSAGTVRVTAPLPGGVSPQSLTNVNGTLLFQATDPWFGAELWSSNGTPEGTFPVQDIAPGPNPSSPGEIMNIGSFVYFAATDDGASGRELWSLANQAPTAYAGSDQVVVVGDQAWLNGAASFDPDGGPLFYEWHDATGAVISRESSLALTLPAGVHPFTLVVRDGLGGRSQDDVVVTVDDVVRRILSVSVEGTDEGTGVVSVGALGEACDTVPGLPHVCVYPLPVDTVATLVPTPGAGSVFTGWVGACTGTGSCTLTLNEDRAVWATFRGTQPVTVTVESVENGGGDVQVGPSDVCAAVPGTSHSCTFHFPAGTPVGLSAAPDPRSVFLGWEGDCTGILGCALTMDGPKAVTARLRGPQPLVVTVESIENGGGDVTAGPSNVCPAEPGTSHSCTFYFRIDEVVGLYPTPDPLSVFVAWDGACFGTAPCSVQMDGPKAVTARLRGPQPVTVTIESLESGGGDVSLGPPNVCHAVPGTAHSCTFHFRLGANVLAVATPDPQSVFAGWAGACTGPGPCGLTVDGPALLIAPFHGPQPLVVTVESIENGGGDVVVIPSQVCPALPGASNTCTFSFPVGTEVFIGAFADPQSVFLGFSGACAGTETCVLTMDAPQAVTARFRGPQPVYVTAIGMAGGGGDVLVGPSDLCHAEPDTTQACTFYYRLGTSIDLWTVANPTSVFMGWGGQCSGLSPCTLTMDNPKQVSATFNGGVALQVIPAGLDGGSGAVRVQPGGPLCHSGPGGAPSPCVYAFPPDTPVTLIAVPDPGRKLLYWSGACAGSTPVCLVTMSSALQAVAFFGPSPPTVP